MAYYGSHLNWKLLIHQTYSNPGSGFDTMCESRTSGSSGGRLCGIQNYKQTFKSPAITCWIKFFTKINVRAVRRSWKLELLKRSRSYPLAGIRTEKNRRRLLRNSSQRIQLSQSFVRFPINRSEGPKHCLSIAVRFRDSTLAKMLSGSEKFAKIKQFQLGLPISQMLPENWLSSFGQIKLN